MLASFTRALEWRDPSMRGHGARVAAHAHAIGRCLRWGEEQLTALRIAAVVHDLGKLSVPVEILRKPGRLTEHELAEVRRHPAAGARMLESVRPLRPVIPFVLHHHERWDGRGYPHGRRGEAIPPEARILAIADAFDAMTSPRPYSRPLSVDQALAEVERYAGSQFDPELAGVFLRSWDSRTAAAVG